MNKDVIVSKQNFSMGLVDNTTWVGTDTQGFYSKALLESKTVKELKLLPDVKSKTKIYKLDITSNILQADDCVFSATNNAITLGQKTLTVNASKVNIELCLLDFEQDYLSTLLKPGALNVEVPADFQTYILGQIGAYIGQSVENLAWNGNTSNGDVVDGFLKKFAADSSIISVTASTITTSNVISEIGKVYGLIPNTITDKGNVKIYTSQYIAKTYKQALAALNNALIGTYNNGDFQLSYIDIPVVALPGLPANVMVAAEAGKNLFIGTDLISDLEDIKVLNMLDTLGQKTVRFVAGMKLGFDYAIPTEIVYYRP